MAKPYDPVIQTYLRRQTPPDTYKGVRYAIAQGPSQVATKDTIAQAINFNMLTLQVACELAAQYKAQLISFPELFLSGYEFGDTAHSTEPVETVKATADFIIANHYLESAGPIGQAAKRNNLSIICPLPFAGKDPAGNTGVFDVAAIFGADGTLIGMQFKNQLWGVDERRWFNVPVFGTANNPVFIFQVNGFPVGCSICFDAEFPEISRALALNGALLSVFPTAAPQSILPGQTEPYPDISEHIVPANALQNQNFCTYSNRAGTEFKVVDGKEIDVLTYSGNSIICSPYGKSMVQALRNEHALLISDCIICDFPSTQPSDTDYLINRRPEIYGVLAQSSNVPFPVGKTYNYPNPPVQHQDPARPARNPNSCN